MASIDVGIHPDPAGITSQRFLGPPSFSTLDIRVEYSCVSVFVNNRPTLDALQAALNEIRADMDADLIAAHDRMGHDGIGCCCLDALDAQTPQHGNIGQPPHSAPNRGDRCPECAAEAIADMAPGELVVVFGK